MDSVESSYTIYSIPAIPAHHHILQYKELRLKALQTDPEHFGTTYEQALTRSFEEWRSLIQSRDKVTIIAALRVPPKSSSPSSSVKEQSQKESDEQHKWVGMVTIVGPKTLKKFGFKPFRSVQGAEEYFNVVGVWVDPDHRRKGLGKKMMESAIAWIRADDVQAQTVEKRTVLLQVTHDNREATGLYTSLGFEFVEVDEGVEDERPWMGLKLGE